jgi:hypothetical protein
VRNPLELWMLPVFALASPLVTLVLAFILPGPLSRQMFEACVLLGFSAPVLGLATLAILATQYSLFGEESRPARMSRKSIALLGALAVISPVWLFVLFVLTGAIIR